MVGSEWFEWVEARTAGRRASKAYMFMAIVSVRLVYGERKHVNASWSWRGGYGQRHVQLGPVNSSPWCVVSIHVTVIMIYVTVINMTVMCDYCLSKNSTHVILHCMYGQL